MSGTGSNTQELDLIEQAGELEGIEIGQVGLGEGAGVIAMLEGIEIAGLSTPFTGQAAAGRAVLARGFWGGRGGHGGGE